ncbi:interleukin-2 [Molossus molossus]|uniref:Interleukin-2 n=1 Tax=Molossus molossus TaxID=27622 RepID=A0A7J8I8R7_MOLMO|nr:interleukin-2 [Molossus molossus]KAF6480392.1 interleukin 2 [Molossus molossus]
MHKMHLLSCVALTLVLLTDAAPTWSSSQDTQQQLEQLMLDLQLLLKVFENHENPKRSMLLTFKFYMPRNATELKHLQCLVEELSPLQDVLNLDKSKTSPLRNINDSVRNINTLVQALKEPAGGAPCEYGDEPVNVELFLRRWIALCQRLYAARA